MFNKKVIGAGLLAGALMAGAAGLAGPASAEPVGSGNYYYPSGSKGDQSVSGYYHDLSNEGIDSSYSQARSLGQMVCDKLQNGVSETTLVLDTYDMPTITTHNQAKVVVWSAEWHFCPSYY